MSDSKVSLLTDLAELGGEIDRARAMCAKDAAEERMRGEQDADTEAALVAAQYERNKWSVANELRRI